MSMTGGAVYSTLIWNKMKLVEAYGKEFVPKFEEWLKNESDYVPLIETYHYEVYDIHGSYVKKFLLDKL